MEFEKRWDSFWCWIGRMIETHFDKLLLCSLIGVSILLSMTLQSAKILEPDPARNAWWRNELGLLIGCLVALLSQRRPPNKPPGE
jgi:hypothetical protein